MNGTTENVVTTLQNIGTAAWFGGLTFGSVALSPAVKVIDDERERGELMQSAWRPYSSVSWLGLGTLAATTAYWWKQPKRRLSETELLIAKLRTGFVAGAVTATAVSAALGSKIAQQTPEQSPPSSSGQELAATTPAPARKAQRAYPIFNAINLACGVGVIDCSALLAHRKRSNTSWLW